MRFKLMVGMLAAGFAGGLWAEALHSVYANPGYVCGIWNNASDDGMSKVPETPTLAAPGFRLEDFLDVTHAGLAGWGAMKQRGEARAYSTHNYYDANGTLQFIAVAVQKYDDKFIKGAVYKLTQGDAGVYVQQLATPYKEIDASNLAKWDFINVADDGTITYNQTGSGSYNFYCYNAMKWVPVSAPALMFKNAPGEPTLTVDDLKDYRFSAINGGASMNPVKYAPVSEQARHLIYGDAGQIEKMLLEMQVMDDRYLKCAVIELTNGEGGVWARNVAGLFVDATSGGVSLGTPFLLDDGSVNSELDAVGGGYGQSVSDAPWVSGYGMAGLTATATSGMTLTLDSSKTWSELAGGAEAVDDAQLDIVVNVTGAGAMLTFDTPLRAHALRIKSAQGFPIAYALAPGTSAPEIAVWDSRDTTGDVTFNGFTPVVDARTDNILPNAMSTLTFNGDTAGFVPFSETAVRLPCAAVVLGPNLTLGSFSMNRFETLAINGDVTLTGAVTGSGTLQLGGELRVAGAVSFAAGVTLACARTPLAVRAVGEGTNSLTLSPEQVSGGACVLEEGVLTASAGAPNEVFPTVGADATLAVVVSATYVHGGYTSPAVLAPGATLRFFSASGEELAPDRPEMCVLPPADPIWRAREEGENALSTDANWSTGTVPVEGNVTLADGGLGGAVTARLVADQAFGTLTVFKGASVTLAAEGGSLAVSQLLLAEGATLVMPIAAVTFEAAELAADSTLVLVGDETERAFAAPISGLGQVVYAGGKFLVSAMRTYRGGTVLRDGAQVKCNFGRGNVAGLGDCGAFGKMYTTVSVEAGSMLDENGFIDQNYYLTLAGDGVLREDGTYSGAFTNTGTGDCGMGKSQFLGVTLAGDASIRLDDGRHLAFVPPGHGQAVTFNLGAYTLTKTGAGQLYVKTSHPINFTGTGKVRVAEGVFWMERNAAAASVAAGQATFETVAGGTLAFAASATVGTLVNGGTVEVRTSGYDLTLTGAYSGDGGLHKYGTGFSAWVPLNNASHGVYTVHEGRLCPNARSITRAGGNPYAFNTEENPAANMKIVVAAGAQWDVDGVIDVTPNVVVAGRLNDTESGGALSNRSGAALNKYTAQIPQLTVAGEAWVGGGNADCGLLAPGYQETLLELGTNTLHLGTATNINFWASNTRVTGAGRVSLEKGSLVVMKNTLEGADWTLAVEADGTLNFDGFGVVCSNLVFRGHAQGTGTITATGAYLPGTEELPAVVLQGPAAALDLSEREEPWALETGAGVTFGPSTGKVAVKTGDRTLRVGQQLLAWSAPPANVSGWTLVSDQIPAGSKLSARGDGLFIVPTAMTLFFR